MMKKIKWILISIVILLLGIFSLWKGYYFFVQKPNTIVNDQGIFYIQAEDSFETIVQLLEQKGYLESSYTFRKVAELKKYPQLIKAGRYRIKNGMNNNDLINMLRSGQQEAVHFTFNNIRTLEEFASTAFQQLAVDSIVFLNLVRDPAYVASLGFTLENVIGLFIPNTYHIHWKPEAQEFVKRMHTEYLRFWNEERIKKAKKISLSPIDIIVLASIIEEETNQIEEYPLIAGVYINRLKKGWKLEACPTLKYAWGDFTLKRILTKHMEIESPYNTYKYIGLPPGPIRMPSIQVIDAVLNYTVHSYLFFCAKSDFSGKHHFSKTLREHNHYAELYHRALNRMKIY